MKRADDTPRGRIFPLQRLAGSVAEMTDPALIAACAIGDAAALGALFDRHSRALYDFASRLSGVSRADLDDMVNATFLEACRSARRFRGRSSVRTWLFGIAVNVARHHVRSDVRRQGLLREYQQVPPRQQADRPDETAERRQMLCRLEACLRSLPHDLRATFIICDVEEVTCAEAARALGLREGTVWKRLHRARKVLGSALR